MNFLFFYVFFYIIFIDNLNNYYEIALCYNKKTIICCNAAPCQISQFYTVLFRNKSKKNLYLQRQLLMRKFYQSDN
jgi:hypothetical protein